MPRPFALRFRWPVTPVDRTKVVPNGNPCQIVSIMAEFPRTTVPAAPAQVLFWQKGRGETEYAKREDGKKNRRADKGTRQLHGQPAGASGRDGEKQPGKGRVTEKQGPQEKQEPPERNKGKYRQKQGVPAKARTAQGEVAGGNRAGRRVFYRRQSG